MGGFFSSAAEPNLIVPTKLEKNFALGDGSEGSSLQDAFEFKSDKVSTFLQVICLSLNLLSLQIDNLYTWDKDSKQFKLAFQEHGVAYGETNASAQLAEVDLNELSGSSNFKTTFDPTPVEAWGINFVGVVQVKHDDGDERVIYIPGTRSYDPAGMSGDPHASERIGPSCSRAQAAITLAQIMAALYGAKEDQVEELQEKLRPLITRYHGREALFDWMLLQIQEAIYQNK